MTDPGTGDINGIDAVARESRGVRQLIAALLCAALAACSGAAASAEQDSGASPAAAGGSGQAEITLSYVKSYRTLDEAMADAELVVVGTVEEVVYSGPDPNFPAASDAPGLPLTEFRLSLERVVKGDPPSPLYVRQVGGPMKEGASVVLVKGDPLMQVGERALLFLQRSEGPVAPAFMVIGGPDGRVDINSAGRLTPRGVMWLSPAQAESLDGALRSIASN